MADAPAEPPAMSLDLLPEWARDPMKLPRKFQPSQDLVIVFPDPFREEEGHLKKAQSTRGKMELVGTVIAKGVGKHSDFTGTLIPIDWVEVGARYTFPKHAGDDMMLDKNGRLTEWLGFLHDDHVLVKVLRAGALLIRILE